MIKRLLELTTFLDMFMLLFLFSGCTGTIGLMTTDGTAQVDLVECEQYRMEIVQTPDSRWILSNKSILFNEKRSVFRSGSERSSVSHRGDALVLTKPVTISLVGDPASPQSNHPNAPDSASKVWVEPGDRSDRQIIVTTNASSIPAVSLDAIGIARNQLPTLSLELWTPGRNEMVLLLGSGTRYWGATKGPVMIGGKEFRNMKGIKIGSVSPKKAGTIRILGPVNASQPSYIEYK